MAAISKISKLAENDILELEIMEEMILPLKKDHDSKELNDWGKESKNLLG